MSEHEQLSPPSIVGWSQGWSRLLETVASLLQSPLGIEQTMRVVTRLPVPSMADFSELYLANPDGALRRVEYAHCDPDEERRAVQLQAWFQDHVPAPLMRVAISNLPLLAPRVDDALLRQLARDPQDLLRLQTHRPRSLMVVPIRCGSVVAALALGHSVSGRNHEAQDLPPAQELARRAGLALDSAFRSAGASRREEFLGRVDHQVKIRGRREERLEPARPDGPGSLQPAPHRLGPLVRRAWERSRYPVGSLELSLPPELPPVEVDADRMVELLRDLMEDAALEGAPDHPLHVAAEAGPTGLRISIHAQAGSYGPEVEPGWWFRTQQVVQAHQGRLERLALSGRRGYALTLPAPVFWPQS